jgi:hypothetical protein
MHQPFLDVSWEQNEKGSHPFGPLHPLDPRVEMARGNNTTTGRKALVTEIDVLVENAHSVVTTPQQAERHW